MQVLREEIIKQSSAQVPQKYKHYFMDVSTPTKVPNKDRANQKVRKEKKKRKLYKSISKEVSSHSSSASDRYDMYKEAA